MCDSIVNGVCAHVVLLQERRISTAHTLEQCPPFPDDIPSKINQSNDAARFSLRKAGFLAQPAGGGLSANYAAVGMREDDDVFISV